MPSRRRNAIDPIQLQSGDFVVHEQHGVGTLRRDGAPHDQRRRARVPDHRVRAGEAWPAGRSPVRTDRFSRPGHQVRRRRGAVAVAPRRRRLGQDQGPRPQGGQGDRRRTDPPLQRADGDEGVTRSRRTPRGSASSRTPSPTSRRRTSSARSTRSRRTWRRNCRWTASSAATSATARPRSPCARRSRRCRTASRWPCSCPTTLLVAPAPPDVQRADGAVPGGDQGTVAVHAGVRGRRDLAPASSTARSTSSSARTACSSRPSGSRISAWSSSTRSSASASSTRSTSSRCAPSVDVLTMSATPIPRTLEMSLTGIREMTTILTPPEERHPILTFVGAYDPRQIARGRPSRTAARRAGLLHPQPGRVDQPGGGEARRARARGAHRRRARADDREPRSSRSWSASGRRSTTSSSRRRSSSRAWTSPTRTR